MHRELFAEHADSYGENIRPKIESCLAVTDAEYERARERRERYREQLAEAGRERRPGADADPRLRRAAGAG